jgi:hypothetical protein
MSSYSSPAAQGSDQATGAYSVYIAAQAGGVNNDGHATDSAGNLVVDYVWGGMNPLQPNDERRGSATNIGGSDYDRQWAATTQVASTNLAYGAIATTFANGLTFNVPSDNHVRAESGWASYPSFASTNQAVFRITQASGDGTTQTYTAPNNFLKAGDTVNITGTGLDGTNLTVASANRYTFTVTASGTGSYINISGTARYTNELTANDGAYVAGVDYVKVPSVLGFLTASAVDALNDSELAVTTAAAATNAAKTVTAIARSSGSNLLVFTASGAGAAYGVGTKVVVSGFANTDAFLNGTYAVVDNGTNTFTVSTPADTSAVSLSGKSGAVVGLAATIKTQSIAAGTGSVAAGAAITITPWAAAS